MGTWHMGNVNCSACLGALGFRDPSAPQKWVLGIWAIAIPIHVCGRYVMIK